jgi:hypothetical protein
MSNTCLFETHGKHLSQILNQKIVEFINFLIKIFHSNRKLI